MRIITGVFHVSTGAELIDETQAIANLIEDQGGDDLGEHKAQLKDYVRRLQHFQQHTMPQLWGNAGQVVPAYFCTLQSLR